MGDSTGEPSRDARSSAISRRDLLVGAVLGGTALGLAACGSSLAPSASSSVPSPPPVPSPSPTTAPSIAPSPSAQPSAAPGPTLREMIAGLIIVGFRGSTVDEVPWLLSALRDTRLGGVILFDRDQETGGQRNVISPRQLTKLVRDLRAAASDREIVVSIDQEGGRVTRLSPAHGFPAVASEAEIGTKTVAAGQTWARGIATTLASVGINLNLAPVVDLDINPTSPAIGALDRSFSADPDVVVAMATAEIEAHRAASVRTTLKHFPGIGSSTANTDFGVADVTRTWTRTELEPFQRLIAAGHADLIMAGHVVNGQLDPDLPASLSKAVVTDLLRGELGWEGIVVTDDLQAAAIDEAFGRDEAVLLALEAGNDLLLFANQQAYDPEIVGRVVDVVAAAVDTKRLPEARIQEAWVRVHRLFGTATG
jgi:beta-N-acetylhexosaminidase